MSSWCPLPRERQTSGVRRGSSAGAAALLAALVFLCPVAGWGQSQPPSPTAPQSKAPQGSQPAKTDSTPAKKHKIGPLDISGSWRVRMEAWDWFEGNTGNSSYVFPHSLLRVAIGQTSQRFDWQIEAAQDMILGLPTGAVVAAPQGQLGLGGTYYAANGSGANNVNAFVKQAYVRVKGLGDGTLRFGRFEYLDGTEVTPKDPSLATLVQTRIAQRLIGNFGFSAVQRSYDGVQFSYNINQNNLTFLAARPTRGVYQIDGMGELDVDLFYGAVTLPLTTGKSAGEVRVFGVGYVDHRRLVLKTDNRPQPVRAADVGLISLGTYGMDYVHVFNTSESGKFNVLIWGVLQNGSWGALDHLAGAFVGEVGWQPPVTTVKPWVSAGFSWGSGDDNPNDLRHGTFFQILPTPRLYARFPFFNMENNQDFYASVVLRPHAKLSLRTEIHSLRLDQAADLWYLGGGAFQPQTFGYAGRPSNGNRSLANVWDLSADYQMTRTFGVGLYYAHAWGKSVIASIYPKDRNGQLFFLETNLRF